MRLLLVAFAVGLFGWCQAEPLKAVTTPMSPYQTLEEGVVSGSNTDWVRRLLTEAGVEAEFAIYPWARAYQLARSEPNVLIYAIARTRERESEFQWIGRIASFELAVLVKSGQLVSLRHSLSQQQRLSLALPRNHAAVPLLPDLPHFGQLDVFYTASTDEALQLLMNGRVDAVVENPHLLPELLEPYQLTSDAVQVLLPVPGSRSDAYLAASKTTSTAVAERLQQAWQRLYGDRQELEAGPPD
ncbi:substrate-binding periplasmic protein [Alkalimonas amylolytica]|uniref:Amino acid ABC transporter substrate-binding protein, PAAT family n=1 Tax=Alkalimonas amylolytica TaxID=152573 RepID=A0A1H3XZK9_ALKAM|nr:transporter substrate-binding domain-containing protein [Alkalimonas amylolytica]SEA04690.1 amino acid ABC transporter substrate-binding protein, PAAT family [Alkalimonas amylolytica]